MAQVKENNEKIKKGLEIKKNEIKEKQKNENIVLEKKWKKNLLLLQNEYDNDYEKFKEILKNKYKDDINYNQKLKK